MAFQLVADAIDGECPPIRWLPTLCKFQMHLVLSEQEATMRAKNLSWTLFEQNKGSHLMLCFTAARYPPAIEAADDATFYSASRLALGLSKTRIGSSTVERGPHNPGVLPLLLASNA